MELIHYRDLKEEFDPIHNLENDEELYEIVKSSDQKKNLEDQIHFTDEVFSTFLLDENKRIDSESNYDDQKQPI